MLGYFRVPIQPGCRPGRRANGTTRAISVDIAADGFITILGRAKRFSKIAGEMVSLLAVERSGDKSSFPTPDK